MAIAVPVSAAVYQVDSIAALRSRVASAAPGDTFVVADGVYTTEAPLAIECAGSGGNPVTIKAATVGGVELRGTHGFSITSPAAHIVIEGFLFAHESGQASIGPGTHHVRFTRNTFHCPGEGPYLLVMGDDAEVDRNEFRDKSTKGNMVSVTGVGGQVARNLWIHHNHFHDFARAGVNGSETIRFGLSGLSLSTGHGLVEHNLFVRCVGENELISNKSCGNIYRYNTFLDSPGAQLTLRHGNDCRVYGNIFRNTDGLRIFGDRHLVFGNYLEGNTLGITLGNGGAEVADGAPLTSHDRPDQCSISFNTMVDNVVHLRMTPRKPVALGATHTTFADNVMQGGGVAAKLEGPHTDTVWKGNVLWKTAGAGDVPESGFSTGDPRLVRGEDGLYRAPDGAPAAMRPVAGARAGEGEPGPVTVRMLTLQEVGPRAP